MPPPDDLVPVFIPSLGAILIHAEDAKGSPLSQAEAMAIRDSAAVIMLPRSEAMKMDESRGYHDIDPENLWHDWQTLRDQLGRKPSLPAGPRFNHVRNNDAELEQAIADAQASLAQFEQLIRTANVTGAIPMFKTRLTDGDNAAFMWLSHARMFEGKFQGRLFEVPANWTTYKVGDVVTVTPDQVMDWMVNDKGHLHGGFSIRVMRRRKPPEEWEQFDEFIGVTSYAPVSDD